MSASRLALGLEARHHLPAVHAQLDDLDRDLAAEGLVLLGQVDDAHAAFAQGPHDAIGPDAVLHLREEPPSGPSGSVGLPSVVRAHARILCENAD